MRKDIQRVFTVRNNWEALGITVRPASKRDLSMEVGSRHVYMAAQVLGGVKDAKDGGTVGIPVVERGAPHGPRVPHAPVEVAKGSGGAFGRHLHRDAVAPMGLAGLARLPHDKAVLWRSNGVAVDLQTPADRSREGRGATLAGWPCRRPMGLKPLAQPPGWDLARRRGPRWPAYLPRHETPQVENQGGQMR